jgi:hypothetical protein
MAIVVTECVMCERYATSFIIFFSRSTVFFECARRRKVETNFLTDCVECTYALG